jgi:alpha-tubulin suppressor-like RCC1 family protein
VTVVGPSNVAQVTAGSRWACARRTNGTVTCWGGNTVGQLGIGATSSFGGPADVVGISDAVEIAAGHAHGGARRANGSVMCWGWNNQGQVGDGTTTNRTAPVMVAGINDAVGLALGVGHTCVLRAGGTVSCWGINNVGQLGDGTTRAHTAPAPVLGITDAIEIVSSFDYYTSYSAQTYADHVCIRRASGAVQCWGYNSNGQIGDGTTTNRLVPATVVGLSDATELAPGGRRHSCARRPDRSVVCWGLGTSGELGNGMNTSRTTPVTVTGLP